MLNFFFFAFSFGPYFLFLTNAIETEGTHRDRYLSEQKCEEAPTHLTTSLKLFIESKKVQQRIHFNESPRLTLTLKKPDTLNWLPGLLLLYEAHWACSAGQSKESELLKGRATHWADTTGKTRTKVLQLDIFLLNKSCIILKIDQHNEFIQSWNSFNLAA